MLTQKTLDEFNSISQGLFAKFDEPLEGAFVGEEKTGWTKWIEAKQRKIPSDRKEEGSSFTFAINFYNTKLRTLQVLERGITFLTPLIALREEMKTKGLEMREWVVKIIKIGSGKKTTYHISTERKLTDEEKTAISKFAHHRLGWDFERAAGNDEMPF